LRRIEELAHLLGIRDGVGATADGARDRAGLDAPDAGDAHEHFGRGADEIFGFAEIDHEAIGSGIDARQGDRDGGWWRGAALEEALARHHLEEIAALETRQRLAHDAG